MNATTEYSYDVFLSYAHQDRPVVLALKDRLVNDGLRVWLDNVDIEPGATFRAKINEGLHHSGALVWFMSAHSFASESSQYEVDVILSPDLRNRKGRFIPLRLDDTPLPPSQSIYQWIDYRPHERELAYPKILKAIRAARALGPQPTPQVSGSVATGTGPSGRKDLSLGDFMKGNMRKLDSMKTKPGMRVLPLISGTEQQLAELDRQVFKTENSFGEDMIELARAQPNCVHILYDEGDRVHAYIDMFFFEPNTFVTYENLRSEVLDGNLPTAEEILSHPNLLTPRISENWTKGNAVDVYIDAICVEGGSGRLDCASTLLVEMARTLRHTPFRDVRINRVATVAVSNKVEDALTVEGPYHIKSTVCPGAYYAAMGLLTRKIMGSDRSGSSREYFSGEFKRSLLEFGAAWVTRAFKPLLRCHQPQEILEWFNSTELDAVISEC